MRTVGCLILSSLLTSTWAGLALAQSTVPPPTGMAPAPTVAPAPAPAPAAAPAATPAPAPVEAAPAADAAPATAEASATASLDGVQATSDVETPPDEEEQVPATDEAEARRATLQLNNTLIGATGLLRVQPAGSGAPGTFRVSFISGFYSGSDFLCGGDRPCSPPEGLDAATDEAENVSADLSVSATLLSFLEAYVGMHSQATSNTFGRPELLQVVGDTNFGAKAFWPSDPDRIWGVGLSTDLWLLNGTGKLGAEDVNVGLRGLFTADFNQRKNPADRIPLRAHLNVGYLFDNTGNLVEDTEKARDGASISRVERFGLDINRVDSFLLGIGAEYVHELVRPFAEWTFDIPVNRQSYACAAESLRSPGDSCLKLDSGFASSPSRITLGVRVTPVLEGLNALLAFDIGTGATSTFIEEVAPEVPWKLYFGVGYAYDTQRQVERPVLPPPEPKIIQLPPPPDYRVVGLVLDERSQQPIPDAIVRYQGQGLTGMVTRSDGSFETTRLDPGTYSFAITADGYRDGTCEVTVTAGATAAGSTDAGSAVGPDGAAATASAPAPTATNPEAPPAAGPIVTNVACTLKALPAVGNVLGSLLDSTTNTPIAGATVVIRDGRGRELSLQTDPTGAFRFENVPAGVTRISVEAPSYLPAATEVEVRARQDQRTTVSLTPRPKKANVVVTPKEVKLYKQVLFATDSSVILPESMAIVQETAAVLRDHPELTSIEIQGHTDDVGSPPYNKRLSQERAEAVRTALVSLGIDGSRLTAAGYGQEKPLVPNRTDANRARNRRVQLVILSRQ